MKLLYVKNIDFSSLLEASFSIYSTDFEVIIL